MRKMGITTRRSLACLRPSPKPKPSATAGTGRGVEMSGIRIEVNTGYGIKCAANCYGYTGQLIDGRIGDTAEEALRGLRNALSLSIEELTEALEKCQTMLDEEEATHD
jgi:hypothetical protein